MPGTPIITVEDTKRYWLEASLKVCVGQVVAVTIDHGKFDGRVVEVVPEADPTSRTFLVKVNLPRECPCRPGEYGKASFPASERKCLLVPRLAIIERGELEGLFVVNAQGIAEYRLVKTGKHFGDRVEVLSGLAEGERVATSQIDRITDGVRVETP